LKTEKTIYVFSGLGSDKRVFQKIDFGNCKPIFIIWIKPKINEKLLDYCVRLTEQITEQNPILIGISFGGIVVQEIATIIDTEKIILLATIERREELPIHLKILGNLKIDKIIPTKLLKDHNFLTDYFFGVKTKQNSEILKNIIADTDEDFFKWAVRQIAEWKPTKQLKTISRITIHGTKDRILPKSRNKKYDFLINGGGHFFTLTQENEINKILKKELARS
jgi:pimeloyl-ACP methyl ester carboxylesterase